MAEDAINRNPPEKTRLLFIIGGAISSVLVIGCIASTATKATTSTNTPEPTPEQQASKTPEPVVEPQDDTKFGYSEQQRFSIFHDMIQAEYRAQLEAEALYPVPDPQSPGYTSEAAAEAIENQIAYSDELVELYWQEVADNWGLTVEQLREIDLEGTEKEWPLPPYPDG